MYAKRSVRDKNGNISAVLMHKFVMGSDSRVDHKNSNGLDNRKRNLRYCNQSQNSANRRSFSDRETSSQYKGVAKIVTPGTGRIRWQAMIRKDGTLKMIGNFDNEQDAALAYDREARRLFGEFARTNFDVDDGRILTKGTKEKISDDQVTQIRELISKGVIYKDIAKMFGVSQALISFIKTGKHR